MDNRIPQTIDEVLDVDSSDQDCLYRIARRSSTTTDVVYVTICDASIIPEDERTESSLILRHLRKLAAWPDRNWRTMQVRKQHSEIRTELDLTAPHGLANAHLHSRLPRYEYFAVHILQWYKHRTSKVRVDGEEVFMKIAQFPHQQRYLEQEVAMYQYLLDRRTPLVPEIVGFVYEVTPDRIIGFFCKAVPGRHPGPADFSTCIEALEKLHEEGIYHGDVNRFNILITPDGRVVFVDLENSCIVAQSDWTDQERAAHLEEEKHRLRESLSDSSTLGQPFDSSEWHF